MPPSYVLYRRNSYSLFMQNGSFCEACTQLTIPSAAARQAERHAEADAARRRLMLDKIKAQASDAQGILGEAAAKAKKAAKTTKEGFISSVTTAKAGLQKGLVAGAGLAAGSTIQALNLALSSALPHAQLDVGKHLLSAAEKDSALMTLLPRPPKRDVRKKLEAEGKSLPPPLYELRVRHADGEPASDAGCALDVLSLSVKPKRRKQKSSGAGRVARIRASHGKLTEQIKNRFGQLSRGSAYQSPRGSEEAKVQAASPAEAPAAADEAGGASEEDDDDEAGDETDEQNVPMPDEFASKADRIVTVDVEVDMAVAFSDEHRLVFYAMATSNVSGCLPKQLWSCEVRSFTFRGPVRLWWDVATGRMLVAFLRHEQPKIECDVDNLTLCCCATPKSVEDELVRQIGVLVLQRFTVDRPLGFHLSMSSGKKGVAQASGASSANESKSEPGKATDEYREVEDAWLML